MKKYILLMFLVSFSCIYADLSIDAQIKEIKNAPPSERVELMNILKVRLSNMNSQERSEAISQLRVQNHIRSRNQKVQDDSIRQMEDMQRMSQKQVGDNSNNTLNRRP